MTDSQLAVWPPLSPGVHFRRPRRDLPFPLDAFNSTLFALGRHCLWQGVRALGLVAGDEVLTPAYHHGSEVQALIDAGLVCRFYGGTASLAPDEAELESLIAPRVRALLLIHYLGFPQEVARWRRWCDQNGLFLIEDAAQAWLASHNELPVGSLGDVSIFCLYKTLGVPDGGALVMRTKPPPASGGSRGIGKVVRRHGAWAIARSVAGTRISRRFQGRGDYIPKGFVLGDPYHGPSQATLYLLSRVSDLSAAERRRANYRFLLHELHDIVPRPFNRITENESPFAFPIAVAHKDKMLERLATSGIAALNFWAQPHPALPSEAFPEVARRRTVTIGLPVHQELRDRDLDRIRQTAASARPDEL